MFIDENEINIEIPNLNHCSINLKKSIINDNLYKKILKFRLKVYSFKKLNQFMIEILNENELKLIKGILNYNKSFID